MSRVPVEPFQQRFHELRRQGHSIGQLARQAGYERVKNDWRRSSDKSWVHGDTTRLQRAIGLMPQSKGGSFNTMVNYDTAMRLCLAWGMDYVDAGV